MEVQIRQPASTKHTFKTKDPVTRSPLKSGGELASQPSKAIQYWKTLKLTDMVLHSTTQIPMNKPPKILSFKPRSTKMAI
jgi:hypothetical protein